MPKKQYTKKQIVEAIKHWEKQLKTLNEGITADRAVDEYNALVLSLAENCDGSNYQSIIQWAGGKDTDNLDFFGTLKTNFDVLKRLGKEISWEHGDIEDGLPDDGAFVFAIEDACASFASAIESGDSKRIVDEYWNFMDVDGQNVHESASGASQPYSLSDVVDALEDAKSSYGEGIEVKIRSFNDSTPVYDSIVKIETAVDPATGKKILFIA